MYFNLIQDFSISWLSVTAWSAGFLNKPERTISSMTAFLCHTATDLYRKHKLLKGKQLAASIVSLCSIEGGI